MNKLVIYKFVIMPNCEHQLPDAAVILSMQVQREDVCIWVLLNPSHMTRARKFQMISTGEEVNSSNLLPNFVGTTLLSGGNFVFHVFTDHKPC